MHALLPANLPVCLPACSLAGLGKTTLAHVCAVHCGYRPVEINASDDRSGASLQGKVLDAVQMQVGGRWQVAGGV
jgi:replication-associated recombination protein RarA